MKITTQAREIMMLRVRQVCGMLALSLAGVLLLYGAPDAYAQKQKKKLTYEQAFALCKEDVTKGVPTGAEYEHRGEVCPWRRLHEAARIQSQEVR